MAFFAWKEVSRLDGQIRKMLLQHAFFQLSKVRKDERK